MKTAICAVATLVACLVLLYGLTAVQAHNYLATQGMAREMFVFESKQDWKGIQLLALCASRLMPVQAEGNTITVFYRGPEDVVAVSDLMHGRTDAVAQASWANPAVLLLCAAALFIWKVCSK